MGDITKNFSKHEFSCPCCGLNNISTEFIKQLQEARNIAQIPFTISSGTRCKARNFAVGGVADSSHLKGVAADIETPNTLTRYVIAKALFEAKFTRIEICEKHIHVDVDRMKPNGLFLKG